MGHLKELIVTGPTRFLGNVYFNYPINFTNDMTLSKNLYLAGGTSYYINSSGSAKFNTLNITGATTLGSTLTVSGAVTLSSTLKVTGTITGSLDGNASTATKTYGTLTNPSSGTTYYIPFHSNASSENKSLLNNNGLQYYTSEGTTSAVGTAQLGLGNNAASGTAGNKQGKIYMYGRSSGYTTIVPGYNSTSNITITLPSSSGTLSLNGHTHNYAGSSSAGGAANSANWLNTNELLTYGASGLQYFNQSTSTTSGANVNANPSNDWYHIIRMNHGNSNGYFVDLATCFHSNAMYYRRIAAGADNSWVRILDSSNYKSYCTPANIGAAASSHRHSYLPLSGGTLTGTLGINGLRITQDPSYHSEMYIGSNSYPHLAYHQYANNGHLYPTTNDCGTLGASDSRWVYIYGSNIYNSSGIITTSDRNKKHDIEEISDEFSEKIVDGLIPSSFKFNDGSSGRTHFGIIAQDLEKLLETLGISTTDFAPLVKDYPDKEVEIENPDYDENDEYSQKYIKNLEKDYDAEPTYNVRYEEFIMILVKYCQGLKKKTLDMEQRMYELEKKVNKLITG